ncbi:MAG TPA: hypothetical protein VIS94_01440 [Desulfomonilia bacterium]
MHIKIKKIYLIILILHPVCFASLHAENFEIYIRPGYDSNVTRSVDDPTGDGYLNGNISWNRQSDIEKTFDWTLRGVLDTTAYFKTAEQDYISAMISPGLTYTYDERFQINISPMIEASAVKDTEQSEISLGAALYFSQQMTSMFYAGEYASYVDSRAKDDIYSQDEISFGAYFGVNITEKLFTELGYEYSYGTSYQTSSIPAGKGKGKGKYSTVMKYDVYQENVNEHKLSLNAGLDLTDKVFSIAGYTFTYTDGDIGISRSNDISVGIGYRF